MAEFTKGKWKAFYGDNFHGIRVAHADDEQGHDYGNGQIIAYVVGWHDGHSWANARLSAAAPEMYDELYEALQLMKGKSSYEGDEFDLQAKSIQELISRIDGKETI